MKKSCMGGRRDEAPGLPGVYNPPGSPGDLYRPGYPAVTVWKGGPNVEETSARAYDPPGLPGTVVRQNEWFWRTPSISILTARVTRL